MNPILHAKIEAAKLRVAEAKAKTLMLPDTTISSTHNTLQTGILAQNEPEFKMLSAHDMRVKKWKDKLGFNPFEIDNKILNEQQSNAVEWFGLEDKTGCLIGPAGTGKTTTMKAIVNAAIAIGRISPVPRDFAHKHFAGSLGIWGGSYTRIATRNLAANMPEEMQGNITTLHKMLEFEPRFYEVIDPVTGKFKNTMRFEPARNRANPLPEEICMSMFDESSMIGTVLHGQYLDALPSVKDHQFIYIGDIAQLPPVFDDAILGFKLLSELVVELTEVYRHAGRIVNLANHIRIGKTIPGSPEVLKYLGNPAKMPLAKAEEYFAEWNGEEDGSIVTIHAWKKRLTGEDCELKAIQNLSAFFKRERLEERYNPISDIILMPFEKETGKRGNMLVSTMNLNKFIANQIDIETERVVWEMRAGRETHYFAVGDKVFFMREEAEIVSIKKNPIYAGSKVQAEGAYLNRWGGSKGTGKLAESTNEPMDSFDDLAHILDTSIGTDEETKHAASHEIEIRIYGETKTYKIAKAVEVNELLMGYALTIHKSQGSQWPKVYCVFHNSHNRNLQRELLYTAITRAQKELYVICEPETFILGVQSQKIKGNTLAQKAEYFKGKQKQIDATIKAIEQLAEENEE